jgi:hypothetical protein
MVRIKARARLMAWASAKTKAIVSCSVRVKIRSSLLPVHHCFQFGKTLIYGIKAYK